METVEGYVGCYSTGVQDLSGPCPDLKVPWGLRQGFEIPSNWLRIAGASRGEDDDGDDDDDEKRRGDATSRHIHYVSYPILSFFVRLLAWHCSAHPLVEWHEKREREREREKGVGVEETTW